MLKIITDSATDMPRWIVERYHLHVIPTPVVIDNVDYLDGATITADTFYDILDDVDRDVKTYHINPAMFEAVFRPYAERGDTVIYMCFSTGIAGTFNAANTAKQAVLADYPDFDLTIVDSKSASLGFGLIVYRLLLMQEHGADKELLLRAADFYVAHIRHVFTVRTLKYLVKGGRLPKWKGTAGEVIQMKPVIIVNPEGELEVLETVRGRKKSIRALVDYAAAHAASPENQFFGVCHGEDREICLYTEQLLQETVHPGTVLESVVGCAIGAHTGRGIVGVVFFDAVSEEFEKWQGDDNLARKGGAVIR